MSEALTGLKRSCMCANVSEAMIGQEVTVMGWVQRRRDLGQLIFIALRDKTGLVQIAIDENTAEKELFAKAETVRSEYVLAVRGEVAARTEGNINPNMKTGKIEIIAKELRILSDSETTPFQIEDNITVKDDLRLKYRYLDLRRPSQLNNLVLRHKVVQVMRNFLDQENFLEIETPILGKSTPEGARDYLVPSRVHPGNFYGLPQSPQLYKQLLMVSGMDRYYQIAKCFRDEDLRADRQPEFTQVDMELSFVDIEDIMDINERMMQKVFKDLMNVDIQLPLPRMTYAEAMERFGSDKPDVRFGMELKNISDVVAGTEFVVFKSALENGGSVRAINAKGCGSFPRKKIDSLVEFVKTYRAKGLAWIVVNEDGTLKSQIAKFFTPEKLQEIVDAMEGQPGDLILICADQDKVVFDSLGALRLELSRMLELTRPDDFAFLWITEFPMLEWDEEENRYVAVHHPFTAPMDEGWWDIFSRALLYGAIAIGVPYIISGMYFTIIDKNNTIRVMNYENVVTDEADAPKTTGAKKKITLFDNSGTLKLSLSPENLYYIESDDNYIKVWYTDTKGELKQYMLRCRLKTVEESFKGSGLVRCNRKYIVNIKKVAMLRKESEGYVLDLGNEAIPPLPVTKTYTDTVLSHFTDESPLLEVLED